LAEEPVDEPLPEPLPAPELDELDPPPPPHAPNAKTSPAHITNANALEFSHRLPLIGFFICACLEENLKNLGDEWPGCPLMRLADILFLAPWGASARVA